MLTGQSINGAAVVVRRGIGYQPDAKGVYRRETSLQRWTRLSGESHAISLGMRRKNPAHFDAAATVVARNAARLVFARAKFVGGLQ